MVQISSQKYKHVNGSFIQAMISGCIPHIISTMCKSTEDGRQYLKEWKQTDSFWRVFHLETTLLYRRHLPHPTITDGVVPWNEILLHFTDSCQNPGHFRVFHTNGTLKFRYFNVNSSLAQPPRKLCWKRKKWHEIVCKYMKKLLWKCQKTLIEYLGKTVINWRKLHHFTFQEVSKARWILKTSNVIRL